MHNLISGQSSNHVTAAPRPLLTIFIDGLHPDSLSHMPFLSSLPHQRRLRTELGYSITCHATMYSGVRTDRHQLWFVWQKATGAGPFRWLRPLRVLPPENLWPAHYGLSKVIGRLQQNSSWFGVPPVVHVPFRYWSDLDVSETRQWDEDGYLQTVPTLFEILRGHGVGADIVGMDKTFDAKSERIAAHTFGPRQPWTYVFIGDVDSLSHTYRQDSPEAAALLSALDERIRLIVERYARDEPEFDCIVYSDHGHVPVDNKIDIYDHFARHGQRLWSIFHVIDANYARFWFRSDRERAVVERALAGLPGFILDETRSAEYRVEMPDNRYGDLIFYLDRPNIFSRTIWGFSRGQNSMHGYLPDYPECDGIFLSTRAIGGDDHVTLPDILPTHLSALGVPIPSHVEGRSRWATDVADAQARSTDPAAATPL